MRKFPNTPIIQRSGNIIDIEKCAVSVGTLCMRLNSFTGNFFQLLLDDNMCIVEQQGVIFFISVVIFEIIVVNKFQVSSSSSGVKAE